MYTPLSLIPHRTALANALLGSLPNAVPIPSGNVIGFDGVDTNYRFDIYRIFERPEGVNAVYAFASLAGTIYRPLYIGRADILSSRLAEHDRHEEAVARGATHLLVHVPGTLDRINYKEAERRLIQFFAPPLNTQHNPLRSLYGA
jgi:hypothetical protein